MNNITTPESKLSTQTIAEWLPISTIYEIAATHKGHKDAWNMLQNKLFFHILFFFSKMKLDKMNEKKEIFILMSRKWSETFALLLRCATDGMHVYRAITELCTQLLVDVLAIWGGGRVCAPFFLWL